MAVTLEYSLPAVLCRAALQNYWFGGRVYVGGVPERLMGRHHSTHYMPLGVRCGVRVAGHERRPRGFESRSRRWLARSHCPVQRRSVAMRSIRR